MRLEDSLSQELFSHGLSPVSKVWFHIWGDPMGDPLGSPYGVTPMMKVSKVYFEKSTGFKTIS